MRAPDIIARRAYRLVLAAGLLAMLAVNLPGHLSTDSVVALHQGRTGVRETWAPAVVSWILGRFDALSPGTSLYVTASGERVMILRTFVKKTQKAPRREIELAQERARKVK